ncbi:MAG: hypothetical protein EOO38_08125 [Cytophagaceae bacterium]|nr:MAG: hypothetical protein EOO38_08125 [Cytophagaceae bacterium]
MTSALDEELKLEEDLARDRAQSGLLAFTRATFVGHFAASWHHVAICRTVNYMMQGRTPRQLLASFGITGKELQRQLKTPHPVTKLYAGMTQPGNIDKPIRNVQVAIAPRMGKSELLSRRLPAWLLGRDPDMRIISASYGTELSRDLARDVVSIIKHPNYRRLFTETRLGRSVPDADGVVEQGKVAAAVFEIVGRKGKYRNAGVGSSLTGYGGDLNVVDDPIKNRQDAESPVIRKTLLDWFQSVFYTRLEADGKILIGGTRWHERDLAGVTLHQAMSDPDAEQYQCCVYPSILDSDPSPGDPRRKDGEALWPGKSNEDRLKRIKASMSVYEFEALHQQRPSPPEGGIVKVSWFNFYDVAPTDLRNYLVSVDLSFKDRGDYCAFQVWAERGADKYLLDMTRERMTFTQQIQAMRSLCKKWPQARVKLVEDAANGAALIDTLKREIPGVISVQPVGSKMLRLDAVSPMIEAGNVFLPNTERAKWVEILLEEIRNFPNGSFDDTIDALSMALWRMMKKKSYTAGASPITFGKQSYWEQENY